MLTYPEIDPVAFSLGPLKVHWYGVMYLLGFGVAWWLGSYRARQRSDWKPEEVGDVIFYGALGVILGGRLGYILFYDPGHYLTSPLDIVKVWRGGMSFHGGMLGVLVAMTLYGRKTGRSFFAVTDFIAPLVPIGLASGRLGNFINGELWGRVTDVPWAMVFPGAGSLPRHPSQLYEALLEGVMLLAILWIFSAKSRPIMSVSAMFLIFYGLFRCFVEFFRMPDSHLGFIAFGWLTMGQLLSLPMLIGGILLLWWAYKKPPAAQY